ncbi:MAG TPA: phosphodiester glycosidase family protein [Gemmatimonadaceae bacterium]|nr:phosphodiester glycosidase family protein [Gemmatimonadaceae bacterium]
MTYKLLSLVVVLTVSARPGAGQQFDSTTSRMVAPGVVHRRVVVNRGPWHVNILEVNLRQPGVVVRGVRAHDSFVGRETVSSMAKRYNGPGKVVGAVNADFFNIRATGESENNVVIEGRLWKGVRITDSPYDAFNTIHSQFGLDSQNHPLIERFEFEGRALGPRNRTANLDALNFWPDSNALVLYTAAFGDSTPPDSTGRHLLVVPLRSDGRRGDTLIFERAGKERQGWSLPLVAGGVLAAGGKRRSDLRALVAGVGAIKVVASLVPNRGRLRSVVGGWPRLIVHGQSVAARADSLEGTFPRFSSTRHPRTAVGFSADSSKLFLITVDGRRESDSGMTLVELAQLMLDLGVYEGMNFDGGGSTTMVVNGQVVNSPSDKTGERAVGSALLVVVDDPRN